MMKRIISTFLLFFCITTLWAQATFKGGWETYKTALITHEYVYNYTFADSFKLYLADSSVIFTAPDSAAVLVINYPLREKTYNKTINYFNNKKLVVKTEEYKGDNLMMVREWRYDDKNRKNYYHEENKMSGVNYKKNYDYSTDKKTGELVINESAYYNGKIEFYTKSYYDRRNVKVKEIRLNDNNKDVIHIETYTYGDNGKVKERSVYFPEFKVTKKFIENNDGDEVPKCYKVTPLGTAEHIYLPGRINYLKNFLTRIKVMIFDPECTQFQYRWGNVTNDIWVCSTKVNNGRQVIFRYKERP